MLEAGVVVGGRGSPQREEVVAGEADLAEVCPEVLVHERGREDVEARGDRGVGGEALVLHQDAHALEPDERRVALVHVAHHGVEAERVQGAQAAHSQHDLLADAVLLVAAVELVGDVLDVRRVLGDVRVEEVERHPAHLRAPDLQQSTPPGEVDLDAHRLLLAVGRELDRDVVEVVDRVALLLPAVGAQVLAEVALLVEEPHADERHPEVARRS